jgi:hypothetical protein
LKGNRFDTQTGTRAGIQQGLARLFHGRGNTHSACPANVTFARCNNGSKFCQSCAHPLAHAPSGSNRHRHRRRGALPTGGEPNSENDQRRCRDFRARRQALAWRIDALNDDSLGRSRGDRWICSHVARSREGHSVQSLDRDVIDEPRLSEPCCRDQSQRFIPSNWFCEGCCVATRHIIDLETLRCQGARCCQRCGSGLGSTTNLCSCICQCTEDRSCLLAFNCRENIAKLAAD